MGLLSMGALGVATPKIKEKLGKNAGFALGTVPGIAYRKRQSDKADDLEQAKARVAAPQAPKTAGMNKGGATHKMPDGTMMKGASHKMGHGGRVKKMSHGGSASKRADGCAVRGKTKGRMV